MTNEVVVTASFVFYGLFMVKGVCVCVFI